MPIGNEEHVLSFMWEVTVDQQRGSTIHRNRT